MSFEREIQRLLLGYIVFFGLIVLFAAYYAIIGPETLLERDDNVRLLQAEAAILRGAILDRSGSLLVDSVAQNGVVQRRYLHTVMNSALGYYSLFYGSGAEAAFETLLRGADLPQTLTTYLTRDLLHLPQRGSDIRLSFDLEVQRTIVEAMGERSGAVVVIAVPTGDVIALVSLPTFNPNLLDENWPDLSQSPEQPFFNRVLQGDYQPGNAIQTVLAAAAAANRADFISVYDQASAPILVGEVSLNCAQSPPQANLSLQQAYAYGCPAPFSAWVEDFGLNAIQPLLGFFDRTPALTLAGYAPLPETNASATPAPTFTPDADNGILTLADALGQGNITLTPFEMAVFVAAMVNDGNAPLPTTLLAVRPPDQEWQDAVTNESVIPVTSRETSLQMRNLMRGAVLDGSASAAAHDDLDIGGHTGLAYSGDRTLTWFVGFVQTGERAGFSVTVVLENSDDLNLAAQIGGLALAQSVQEAAGSD
jgi:peptidoglycan glycosyltransferase